MLPFAGRPSRQVVATTALTGGHTIRSRLHGLVHLLSADAIKAERSEAVLALRQVISVRVLDGFAQVASRKLGMRWREVTEALADIRRLCAVRPLTVEVQDLALLLVQRHAWRGTTH